MNNPSSWIAFLDCGGLMYSPVAWSFNSDWDGDNVADTYAGAGRIYNYAEPKIHKGGLNVGLCDGHVEWISFATFLAVDNGLWKD